MVIVRKGEKVVAKRSPGGRLAVKHKASKPARAHCGLCGAKLNAVPRAGVGEMAKYAKTEKRPERKWGGVLCHKCTASVIRNSARIAAGRLARRDIDIRQLKFMKA